jgi:hypothetical protein
MKRANFAPRPGQRAAPERKGNIMTEYPQRLPAAVPDGRVLVHNQVAPVARQQGARGSR